jgi:hypothetical protein
VLLGKVAAHVRDHLLVLVLFEVHDGLSVMK